MTAETCAETLLYGQFLNCFIADLIGNCEDLPQMSKVCVSDVVPVMFLHTDMINYVWGYCIETSPGHITALCLVQSDECNFRCA